jgi:hypothetical protein
MTPDATQQFNPTKGATTMKNAYTNNGYTDRADYLETLCEEYPREIVHTLADLLGPDEDFDGLVSSLEDFAEGY